MHHHRVPLIAALSAAIGCYASTGAAQSPSTDDGRLEELTAYGTQRAIEGATGSRLNLTVAETPATVDIIDGDAIRARIDTSVLEAVTRSAGLTNEANPGNGHSSIAARGFRGQGAVTKLYDGTNYYTAAGTITFPFDTWGVERIEVLKGPASVLYGEGGIGGAINVIPKRPQQEQSTAVRLMLGRDDTTFVGIDHTEGLTDSIAYRLNFSKNESDNWVNNGESDARMLSFALAWDVNDDLELSARVDSGEQSPMTYFGIPVVNGGFMREFVGMNFNVADARVSYDDDSMRVEANWRISDSMSMEAELFRLSADRYWRNSEFYSYDEGTQLVTRWDPLVLGHDMDHDGFRTNFAFSKPGSAIDSSFGFEMNRIEFARPSNFGPGNPDSVDFGTAFDTVDPYEFRPGTLRDLTDAAVVPDDMSDASQWAIFGESRVGLADRLALVLALRYEDTDTDYVRLGQTPIDQSVDALTGRIGGVFDLDETTALYAQYATGATHPSNSLVTASASNREAEMIESEQIEIGLKQQISDSGLEWNIALFDIVKNNLVEDDPDSGDPSDLIVIPEQTSRGIELGTTWSVSDAFQLYGNLAVLDAETDAGETPQYIPEETLNLGLAWHASERFRVVADARHVGERFHPSRPIPAYTVVDASARWNVNGNIGVTVKADNVFDELYASASYYSSTWLVGKPRTVSFAADYRF